MEVPELCAAEEPTAGYRERAQQHGRRQRRHAQRQPGSRAHYGGVVATVVVAGGSGGGGGDVVGAVSVGGGTVGATGTGGGASTVWTCSVDGATGPMGTVVVSSAVVVSLVDFRPVVVELVVSGGTYWIA